MSVKYKTAFLSPNRQVCDEYCEVLWGCAAMDEDEVSARQLNDLADILVDYIGFQHPKDTQLPASRKQLASYVSKN
jgi:hypothetical protein